MKIERGDNSIETKYMPPLEYAALKERLADKGFEFFAVPTTCVQAGTDTKQ